MSTPLQRSRQRIGWSMLLFPVLVGLWYWWPGLPVLWGPRASAATKAAGRALFEHEWTAHDPLAGGDGLGPVFNATSCVACHFQGGVGGGGPNTQNVMAFEAQPSKQSSQRRSGLIHHFAVDPADCETPELLRKLYPIIPGTPPVYRNYCLVSPGTPDFDPLRTESINSTALFGAGWIDRVGDNAIIHNQRRKGLEKLVKEFDLDFSTVPPGRARILPNGRIGKFGWRGQFATLTEFVAAACANELGLGNPLMEQAKPVGRQDYPAVKPDLNRQQFAALVAFVDTLPRPVEFLPKAGPERAAALRGKVVFNKVGCAICHVPDLGGVQGIYSDLLLYELDDRRGADGYDSPAPASPRPEGDPRPSEWKTPPLWGVADSAPYFHDGASPTLESAIARHRGDADSVAKAYQELAPVDQQAVIAFLKTLKAPKDVSEVNRSQN